MQPLGSSGNNNQLGKCSETSSKCVIWDGPDINCLGVQLCAGQSIEVVIYNTAKVLCDLLDMLNINMIDLECLTPPAGGTAPQNIQELAQLIITKLCELNQDIIDLQNTGSTPVYVPLPDCDAIIANCPANVTTQYTDSQGNTVTSLLLISADGQTSPAVEYFATLICDLLCRMTTAESEIADLRADVDNLINQAAGALPPVDIQCPAISTSTQLVDPNDPTSGVVPDIGNVLCDTITQLTGTNPVTTLNNYNLVDDCFSNLYNATPMGVYPLISPPPVKLGDLGAINNPTNLQEIMTNVWVALCDLRNFATIVKGNCCPAYCNSVTSQLAASPPDSSVPGASTRDTIRVIMAGTFINFYGANVTASSVVPSPGFDPAGPPSYYYGFTPYTLTISDQSGNSATFNEPSIEVLYAGSYFDATGLTSPPFNLVNTDDYDVTLAGYITAPDYTTCPINLSLTVPAVCDNRALQSLNIVQVGYDGVTLQYTEPVLPWPSSGTTPQSFVIEIFDSLGTSLETATIDYMNYPSNYIYIYGDVDHILPNPGACISGCANFIQSDKITPNGNFYVTVSIQYNCGVSAPTPCPTFLTFVPIEITLDASLADSCVLQGDFALIPESTVPTADLSANFQYPISFTPTTPTTVTVYAKAGTKFGFNLNTPYIVDTPIITVSGTTVGACPTNSGTRCWGPPSLYKYYPGNVAAGVFQDAIRTYPYEGCYDYVDCILSVDGSLGYAGVTSVKNISNTGNVSQQPGNAIATFDNSPTSIGYDDLQIPSNYSLPQPIPISINPTLHPLNGGAKPSLKIIIDDPNSYLTDQALVFIQPSALAPKLIAYNADTMGWFGAAGITPVATSYTSSPQGWTASPEGVPIFIQIEVYKWIGSGNWSSSPNYVYYVTSDWVKSGGLPNIATTGFTMNTPNIGLRDKVRIMWTTGCSNQNSTSPYTSASPYSTSAVSYGKLELSQDPYPGVIGPFSACDTKSNISYNTASAGYNIITPTTGCSIPAAVAWDGSALWGDVSNLPQSSYNITGISNGSGGTIPAGCPLLYAVMPNAPIEFIVSHDTTIKWTLSNAALTC